MADILVKFVGVILSVVLLLIAPVVITSFADDLTIQRTAYNTVTNFTDVVADKGVLTKDDFESFMTSLHTTGILFDVYVTREMATAYNGSTYYVTRDRVNDAVQDWSGDSITFNRGDVIKVTVEAKNYTLGQMIARRTIKLFSPKINFTTSQVIRN